VKLDHPGMRLIRAACHRRVLEVTKKRFDPTFLAEVEKKSRKISLTSSRSHEEVYETTLIGELGEHAIVTLLQRCGVDAVHNDEEATGEYHWDVMAELLKGEIKFQGEGLRDEHREPKLFFSFSSGDKDELMRQKWSSIDFIIAFYMKVVDQRTFVIPWLIINNEAINPELGLYQESKYKSLPGKTKGHFLAMNVAYPKGLFERLNVDPNLFTF